MHKEDLIFKILGMWGILFFLKVNGFSSEVLFLKEKIVSTQSKLKLGELFLNSSSLTNEVNLKSKYYSGLEIARLLSENGIENSVVVGKGIEIKIIDIATSRNKLLEEIKTLPLKRKDLDNFLSNLPDEIGVSDFNIKMDEENIRIDIEGVKLTGGEIIFTNFSLFFEVEKGVNNNEEKCFLKNIRSNIGDLIYIKRGMVIKMRVKIIKKLDEETYIVENLSGKIIKVRIENED